MVERPIKRSERQAAASSDPVEKIQETESSPVEDSHDSIAPPLVERSKPRPSREKDRKKGKEKGDRQESERAKTGVNPALARGPKPTKPKAPVVKETQSPDAEDEVSEEGVGSGE